MISLTRFAPLTALLAACAPQVVNAVDEDAGRAGVGSSTGGVTGGSGGVTGGAAGTPAAGAGAAGSGRAQLVHRYSFDGTGAVAADSVSGADGAVVNTVLAGDGTVALDGGFSSQYVDLPRFIVSRLDSATFEAWVTWSGSSAPWQRIFDFGEDQDLGYELGPEDRPVRGRRYLFLTARTPATPDSATGVLRASYQKVLGIESQFDAAAPLPSGELTQVAVSIDRGRQVLALYVNGALAAPEQPFTDTLAEIYDINNWLGRSSYNDAFFAGTFHEFRIYSFALSEAQITANYERGPNDVAVQ